MFITSSGFYLFLAVLGLPCCKQTLVFLSFSSCSVWPSVCGDVSYSGAQALGRAGFSSCGSQALGHRLSSCGT